MLPKFVCQRRGTCLAAFFFGILAAALDVYGENPEATAALKALPDTAKAQEIKRLMAEVGSDGTTASSLDGTLLILERKAWEARNPRQDLF